MVTSCFGLHESLKEKKLCLNQHKITQTLHAEGPHLVVDHTELPTPLGVVEELAVVEAVVVGAVRLGVVRRRQHRHLVAVDGVVPEEVLHFVRHLVRRIQHNGSHHDGITVRQPHLNHAVNGMEYALATK